MTILFAYTIIIKQTKGGGFLNTFDASRRAIDKFEKIYKEAPEFKAFTPYRICPLGAHIDHQLGKITGFAIDKGIHLLFSSDSSGKIEISSLQFDCIKSWNIKSSPEAKQNDWADHLRGAVISLAHRHSLHIGLCGVLDGELPIGGLSSSAAVIITFLTALCRLNNISISERELVEIAREAENKYVGVNCGKLDQSCEVYCRKDKLLYMDMRNDSIELIPAGKAMKPYSIIIFFSGIERSLAGSKYNLRVDECKGAAYNLMSFSGMECDNYEETFLRNVPYEVYLEYRSRLSIDQAKRAEHFYSEIQRVENGVKAFRSGNIEEFGKLVSESGHSSIYNYEAGSPELKALYNIMNETKGIYGGRFSGAGFKGCCMAIVSPEYIDEILAEVERKYLEAFPQLEGKYSAHICRTADGVTL